MDKNHPCLVFSQNLVSARVKDNHNKLATPDNDELIIKMAGKQMQLMSIKRLIRTIIHESNTK